LQDFVETSVEFQFFLDNGDENIHTDSDPDLGLHGVLGGSIKRLDSKMLFYPLEKEFYLPTAFVQLGNGQRVEHKIVRQEYESFGRFEIDITDPTKGIGIFLRAFWAIEKNRLIASESCGFVDEAVVSTSAIEISLGANDKESRMEGEDIEAGKIDIATIQNVKRTWFQDQLVEEIDIVDITFGHADKTGDTAMKVHQSMEFDGTFAFSKMSPREKRETEVDCGRVEDIGGLIQNYTEIVFGIQVSCFLDQHVSKIGVDPPISVFVGFGEGTSSDFAPNPCVIEFGLQGAQTCFDLAETFSVSQLSEGHTEKLIEAGKSSNSVIALVPLDTLVEFEFGQKVHELGENNSPRIHRSLLSMLIWKEYDRKESLN
jgi:hypothetical protein